MAIPNLPTSIRDRLDVSKRLARAFWLEEVFMAETYYWLVQDTKPNTTAYDIGAGSGESAIYLAMQPDVKNVLSYEAKKENYEIAKRNIRLNPRSKKIMLVNQKVEKLSNIKKNSIIKMDVEGDETKILKNSVLKNAYKIMIEYHNTIEECVEILKKQGFRTSIKDDHLEKGMRLGYIKAWR